MNDVSKEIDRSKLIDVLAASEARHPFPDQTSVLAHFEDGSGVWPTTRMSSRLRDLLRAGVETHLTVQHLHRVIQAQYIDKKLGGFGEWIGEIGKIAGHLGGQTNIRPLEDPEWAEVADIGRALYRLDGENIPEGMRHRRAKSVANAAARLIKRGIVPALDNVDLHIPAADLIKATAQIQSLLDRVGVTFAVSGTLGELRKQGQRGDIYLSGRKPAFEKLEHAAPVNFILQLAMKSPPGCRSSFPTKVYKEAVSLATDLIAVLDVEPFSQFDEMFVSPGNLIKRLRDLALFDACHSLRQWRPQDANFILKSFFSSVDKTVLKTATGWDVADALNLLDGVFQLVPADGIVFNRNQLDQVFSPNSDLDVLLAHFSHRSGQVNTKFVSPGSDPDAMFKPLIEIAPDQYMVVARSLVGPAFYEAIQAGVRSAFGIEYANDLSGDGTENVVTDLFAKAGVDPLLVNALYDMPEAGDGECDLVFGNEDYLVFVETKAKALTRATMAGKPGEALLDLAGGMFAGQLQALHHERLIREFTRLHFEGGEHLGLNECNLIKLSVTLLDHGALQDRILLRMFYATLINSTFAAEPDFSKATQVSKLNDIIAKALDDIIDLQARGHDPIEDVGSTASLNVGLLAIILDDVTNSASYNSLSEFCERATRPLTYGTFNPMTEYLLGYR